MGVKISLPPPGAGGPAGPDAGAVTREMQLAGNRGQHAHCAQHDEVTREMQLAGNVRAGRARPLQSSE